MSDVLDQLILALATLPRIGPKGAQKIGVWLVGDPDRRIIPLVQKLADAATKLKPCCLCGNVDELQPSLEEGPRCQICANPDRDTGTICVVASMADLMAMERGGYDGRYHVLGGLLSAINGVGPKDLLVDFLVARAKLDSEVILALPMTQDGQTTAAYIIDKLVAAGVREVSRLLPGIPVGLGIDALADETITAALKSRQPA